MQVAGELRGKKQKDSDHPLGTTVPSITGSSDLPTVKLGLEEFS
jgi:hypothetical protein